MARASDRFGAAVVHDVFGANFEQQGRGLYVALEFFAIAKGTLLLSEELLPSPGRPVSYLRRSHDFGRRLATGAHVEAEALSQALQGATTRDTLAALLSSLVVDIPGRRTAPRWFAAHLYPYIGELIHYDAVERRGQPAIERYTFRDGGGLIHLMLRSDPDTNRLRHVREGLRELLEDSGTALGQVAEALTTHDAVQPTPFEDSSEMTADTKENLSPWPELIRTGVDRILRRTSISRAKRVEQLMHWFPYGLARHQAHLALRSLEREPLFIPVDFQTEANALRARSQQVLDELRWTIVKALQEGARRHYDTLPEDSRLGLERHLTDNPSFASGPRAFFAESLAAVGALNATGGRRHFTMKVPLLEAVLSASLEPNAEMSFEALCRKLLEDHQLVVDQEAARAVGLTLDIDERVMGSNALAMNRRLTSAGLLTHYSDTTSLVHGEAR